MSPWFGVVYMVPSWFANNSFLYYSFILSFPIFYWNILYIPKKARKCITKFFCPLITLITYTPMKNSWSHSPHVSQFSTSFLCGLGNMIQWGNICKYMLNDITCTHTFILFILSTTHRRNPVVFYGVRVASVSIVGFWTEAVNAGVFWEVLLYEGHLTLWLRQVSVTLWRVFSEASVSPGCREGRVFGSVHHFPCVNNFVFPLKLIILAIVNLLYSYLAKCEKYKI